jgi:hypothetical protein
VRTHLLSFRTVWRNGSIYHVFPVDSKGVRIDQRKRQLSHSRLDVLLWVGFGALQIRKAKSD